MKSVKKSNSLNKKIAFGIFAILLIALVLALGLAFGLKNTTTKKVVDEVTKKELTAAKAALAEIRAQAAVLEAKSINSSRSTN